MRNNDMGKLLTTKEVAQELHMGINQTRELIRRKDFPKIKVGERKWIIPQEEFEEWIHKNVYKDLTK